MSKTEPSSPSRRAPSCDQADRRPGRHAVDDDTGQPVHLIGDGLDADSRIRGNVYGRTPDGDRIVLVATDASHGLHAMDQDGRAVRRLAEDVPADRYINAVAVARAL